jgi:endonuclease/exonuclease/phosphatase family metal-dependent hydrolase
VAWALGLSTWLALGAPSPLLPASASIGPVNLKVMTFNIGGDEWAGWNTRPGSPKTADPMADVERVIRKSGADIVGVQEPFGRMLQLAHDLGPGWYASPRLYILSKYPIIEPPGSDGVYGYVEIAPGQVVGVADVHLPSAPNGLARLSRGQTKHQVLQVERRTRLRAIRPILAKIQPPMDAGTPFFFTGDFNSTSWRDWTRRVVRARPEDRYPVKWPVSLAMERAGFHDAYRQLFPNAVRDPGFSWPANWLDHVYHPSHHTYRIDFIWDSGPIHPLSMANYGDAGSPWTDHVMRPWPSDHRALVGTFSVTPVVPPVLVSVPHTRVERGLRIPVTFHRSGPGDKVELVPHGADLSAPIQTRSAGPGDDGTVSFRTRHLALGAYDAVLVDGGSTDLGRVETWIVPRRSDPIISVSKTTIRQGHRIHVSWRNAAGNRYDWLGIYRPDVNPFTGGLWAWRYTHAKVNGNGWIGPSSHAYWPLGPGRWTVRWCIDDAYVCPAQATFRVVR